MLKAVILDMDGVVTNSEPLHLLTFNAAFAPYRVRILKEYWARNYTGRGSIFIVKDMLRRHGLKADANGIMKKRAALFQQGILEGKLRPTAGFMRFWKFLKKSGLKAIVASGGHRKHLKAAIAGLGLAGKLKYVGMEDVKVQKPHPEVFLKAAKKMGAKPSECVVFEDSLAGLEAARRAKIKCIALATTLPVGEIKKQKGVHAIISDFREKRLYAQMKMLLVG
ncbi:HAD family phosphatase [Candidatus Micrarchaeota archaeon]|nr:HAD family phosphatase [Candidatus Micrarchaeota archaeon]